MNYAYPLYGPGLIVNSSPGWLSVATKTDKSLTRTNIYPYWKKNSPLDHAVGIKFADSSAGNYYALFLIQQQIVGQSNSANLAGQDTGGQLQRGIRSVEYNRSNEPSKNVSINFN